MFRKILAFVLISALCVLPAYSADTWREGAGVDTILGSVSPSVIDDDSYDHIVAPLDRLLGYYRRGMVVSYSSATALSVSVGEITVENAAGTQRKMLELTSAASPGWTDIDTETEANSTQYYVYAIAADADATTATFKISTSASAPSGITHYAKIGYFYNDSSGDITNVGNVGGTVSNIISVEGTSDISTTSTTYVDMTDMTVTFVSTGRPVLCMFTGALMPPDGNGAWVNVAIDIDGTDYGISYGNGCNSADAYRQTFPVPAWTVQLLSAGTHTIKAQWKVSSSTAYQYGSTYGIRVLTVIEL